MKSKIMDMKKYLEGAFDNKENALKNIFNINRKNRAMIDFDVITVPKGAIFFRVRADENIKRKNLEESDFWGAPEEFSQKGRLNEAGDSVLYVSLDNPMCAFAEVQKTATPVSNALVIAYESTEKVNAIKIGETGSRKNEINMGDDTSNILSWRAKQEKYVFTKFANKVFTNEDDYDVTIFLDKNLFTPSWTNISPSPIDNRCYFSVHEKESINFLFKKRNPSFLKVKLAIEFGVSGEVVRYFHNKNGRLEEKIYNKDNNSEFNELFDSLSLRPSIDDFESTDLKSGSVLAIFSH